MNEITNQIEIYQSQDGQTQVEVRFEQDTIWLNQKQMAELFGKDSDTIGIHLRNIYKEKELDEAPNTEDFSVVQKEGNRNIQRRIKFYNLDAILSVGYRVNRIEKHDIDTLSNIVFDSILVKGDYKTTAQLDKKEKLIDAFAAFVEQLVELRLTSSKENKLELINFIDKLNMQKELLELEKGEISISDIQTVANRLGRKAQSAFGGK